MLRSENQSKSTSILIQLNLGQRTFFSVVDVYGDYIRPNGLEEDEEYLRYRMVEDMVRFAKMNQAFAVRWALLEAKISASIFKRVIFAPRSLLQGSRRRVLLQS